MKKLLLLPILLIAVQALNAQSKEIKKAQQAVVAGDYASATSYLNQAKRIFAAADSKTRANYYVVEAEMKLAQLDLDTEGIESIYGSLKLADNYEITTALLQRITQIKTKINNSSASIAGAEFKNKNYAKAANLYNIAYQSTKDTLHFLKAARSHLLAKEYDNAFNAYTRLFNMGFTGSNSQYVATNVRTKKKEAFASSTERNKAIKQRTHTDPKIVKMSSKVPELLRGITSSSIHLNKNYKAVSFIDNALAKAPDDDVLLNQALHLYRQLDAKEKCTAIMNQLIKKNPNDSNLYYNFAVASSQNNDIDSAKEFYKKTLEINPKHLNALSNLTVLILDKEKSINDEMNSLGMSEAEDKRYDNLLEKLKMIYHEATPYLENIVKLTPQNREWTSKLNSIYNYMGQEKQVASSKD